MPEKFVISLDEQIAEVRAELALRRNVYRNWIGSGRMKKATGDRKFAAMCAVLHTLMKIGEVAKVGALLDLTTTHLPRDEEGLPE